ncbi:cytochrome P450 [Athelia psychrophila]|uniref:Cytochrome P450 n=1 Tax=Athelia psychrophila TaxID=1759441 RepID=A0A166SV38_9AGAM|nr:cytochrome P450 [Fibularhizoctonia sp. CBS 109695]
MTALLVISLTYALSTAGRREFGLPPGPSILPVVGNLHLFPRIRVHMQFQIWAHRWGDVFSLKIASGTIVVLSSATAVKELVDKTGWNASDRPSMFLVDKITDGNHMGFMKYGPQLRSLKKLLSYALSPQAVVKHIPMQEAESSQLLNDLLEKPEDFYYAIRRHTHSVAKCMVYGVRIPHYTSPDATEFFEALHAFEHTVSPGTHPPIDLLPFLKYVPMRWAPWMRDCEDVKRRRDALLWRLYEECEDRMNKGEDPRSLLEETILKREELELDKAAVAHLGIVMLEGGTDTSAAYLQSLVLLLTACPNAQKTAQNAIDAVVGDARLPVLDDVKQLPYIEALIKEVTRYRPMLPMGLPHAMRDDENYKGYLIPRDAMLFVNLWAIFHDPQVFDNPDIFDPERYLKTEFGTKLEEQGRDFRDTYVFGSGRRMCPGMHIAHQTMALTTMRLLWAFDFRPAVDATTMQPVKVDLEDFSSDITLAPRPFRCSITPRSVQRTQVVRNSFVDATSTFKQFEDGLTAKCGIGSRIAHKTIGVNELMDSYKQMNLQKLTLS